MFPDTRMINWIGKHIIWFCHDQAFGFAGVGVAVDPFASYVQ